MPIHGYPGNVITANPTAPTVSSASGVWTTEQQLQAIAAGNWPGYEYPISRSLRFNAADDAYVSRTFGTPTNNKKWTYSVWMKRSAFAANQAIISSNVDGAEYWDMRFNTSDQIYIQNRVGSSNLLVANTTAVYRDPSAWYHIVFVFDSDNATAANRNLLYVNNVNYTFSANSGSGNASAWNVNSVQHNIGVSRTLTTGGGIWSEFNGYQTEINFIDGQALTPSSFGLNDPETGVWSPKRYTGTYGTNGFYLNFSDNSGTTSTTLGKDSSGNGNNWTPNNFSVTAGVGNDSLVDSPTAYGTDTGVGGEVRGNYATLNPLSRYAGGGSVTLSEGNLKAAFTNQYGNHGTIAIRSGKWYWEAVITSAGINSTGGGIVTTTQAGSNTSPYFGWVLDVQAGRNYYNNSFTTFASSTGVFASGDRLGVAVDMDNGKIWYAKNGTWLGTSADPAAGTGAAQTNVSGEVVPIFYEANSGFSATWEANFGQRAFAYTAPSGFKALCTTNLPTPTIGATSTTQADNYFGVALYSGTGSGNSNVVSGLEFTTDLWWQKARNAANNNYLQDAVRGFGASKSLTSNSNGTEGFNGTPLTQSLSVSSTGFTVSGSDFNGNTASETYVAWCWNAGGSTVTNTSGTISAQVRANTTAGFSIVTYTGNGVDGATVGHGLGVVPSMVIQKRRDGSIGGWRVWHSAIYATSGVTSTLYLNLDYASTADGDNISGVSSTTFTTRGTGATNPSGNGCVAYVFTPVAGYSAFGSYTGNAAADGPFIYTGFRPEFVMIKASSSTGDWVMQDVARSPYNVSTNYLVANASTAEQTGQLLDFVSNGFKIRVAVSGAMNASGATIIYAAFAESPFKYALAR